MEQTQTQDRQIYICPHAIERYRERIMSGLPPRGDTDRSIIERLKELALSGRPSPRTSDSSFVCAYDPRYNRDVVLVLRQTPEDVEINRAAVVTVMSADVVVENLAHGRHPSHRPKRRRRRRERGGEA